MTGFRSIIVSNDYGDELFISNSDRGITHNLFTGNFDQSNRKEELLVAGIADDLLGNHSGLYSHMACYSFVGEQLTELWYRELDGIDILYTSSKLISGLRSKEYAMFILEGLSGLAIGGAFTAVVIFHFGSHGLVKHNNSKKR